MNGFVSMDMSALVVARRMLILSEQAELRRKDPFAATKNLKEIVEEDELQLSQGETGKVSSYSPAQVPVQDTLSISLRDLITRLEEVKNAPNGDQKGNVTVVAAESMEVKTELKISYQKMEPVEGLVRRNRNLAETDRYYLEFKDAATFVITDKWSGRSTSIWGDPHVDTDDQPGNLNGEFSDLKGSETHTTLMLLDGTRVTFTAKDSGVIEAVDIYNGSQHLRGIGSASQSYSADTGLYSSEVDSRRGSVAPTGDMIQAGGDGNDWFANGKLLWGKTTGPIIHSRPATMLSLEYRQEITRQSLVAGIIRQG